MSQTLKASLPSAPVFRSPQHRCLPYAGQDPAGDIHSITGLRLQGTLPREHEQPGGSDRPHPRHHHPGDQQGNPSSSSEGKILVLLFCFSLPPCLSYPSCPSFQPPLILIGLRVHLDLPSFTLSLPNLSLSLVTFGPFSSKDIREALNP